MPDYRYSTFSVVLHRRHILLLVGGLWLFAAPMKFGKTIAVKVAIIEIATNNSTRVNLSVYLLLGQIAD
jgi:hypothetical protein